MIYYEPNLKIFYSDKINDGGYFSGFGTRFLGDGRKIENINNFFFSHANSFSKLIVLEQIHSANISVYKKNNEIHQMN